MAGKLIALESTNQQLLDKTAKYLALKLQSEGHSVEVLAFPQKKQSSSHFVESHQKGEYGEVNPYAASMFYILDRYDASPQIKQLLNQGTTVICKSYRGSSLAKLGASISDAATRRGFYIWADSLESGTFEVPRPDMAIVLSEEIPTLYELCELFPKDYVFAIDPTKVRNILNKLIPPAPAVTKKPNVYITTWQQALKAAGRGVQYSFEPTNGYVVLPKKSKAHKVYADGLKELETLQERALKKVDEPDKAALKLLLSPIGMHGSISHDFEPAKAYKNRVLKAQLTQLFESNYGAVEQKVAVLSASPRNEVDALTALLLPKTELGIDEIENTLQTVPISKKLELFNAYLAGVDNAPADYPMLGISATIGALASYTDLHQLLTNSLQTRFTMQPASPRWGFDIPERFLVAVDEIENCFASSLKLHSQLEALDETDAAQNVVLGGHRVPCIVTIDGAAIRSLAKLQKSWNFAEDVTTSLVNHFPLITDTK